MSTAGARTPRPPSTRRSRTPPRPCRRRPRWWRWAISRGSGASRRRRSPTTTAALRTDPARPGVAGRARAKAALGRKADAQRDYLAAIAGCRAPNTSWNWASCTSPRAWTATRHLVRQAARAAAQDERQRGGRRLGPRPVRDRPRGRARSRWTGWKPSGGRIRTRRARTRSAGRCTGRARRRRRWSICARRPTPGCASALFSYHQAIIERELGQSGAARRHLQDALRTNPYFSPLLAPKAKEALAALGEPPDGGPRDMYGMWRPRPRRVRAPTRDPAAGSGSGSGSGSSSGAPRPRIRGRARTAAPKPADQAAQALAAAATECGAAERGVTGAWGEKEPRPHGSGPWGRRLMTVTQLPYERDLLQVRGCRAAPARARSPRTAP